MSKKTIKIGSVGIGRLGYQHAYNIANRVPGAELTALCARTEKNLNSVADEFGVPYRYTDFEEMCQNPDLDAIVIVSPSALHTEQIDIAMKAGKHVFCDKPLGTSVEACKQSEKVIEAHPDQVFMLGFVRRYDKSYIKMKEKIDNGDIGRIILIRSYSQDPISNIEGAIAYGPHSGGQFFDMSSHDIDLCRWFLDGKTDVKNIWSIGGCFEFEQYKDWNDGDNVATMMQFEDETMAFMFAGRAAAQGYNIETEVIGTRGTLRVGSVGTDTMLEVLSENGVCREIHPDFLSRFEDAFVREMIEFVDCIKEDRQPGISVYDGTIASEIAAACKQSFESGKMLPFNR